MLTDLAVEVTELSPQMTLSQAHRKNAYHAIAELTKSAAASRIKLSLTTPVNTRSPNTKLGTLWI